VTRLWLENPGFVVRIPQGKENFYLFRNIKTTSGPHPASYSVGRERALHQGRGIEFAYLVPKLRMGGTTPPCPYTP
jgi:hypothetical protein